MGDYGFPQLGANPFDELMAQLQQYEQMGEAQQPWSEQIPGGGSSTQLPPQQMPQMQQQGMQRYPNAPDRPPPTQMPQDTGNMAPVPQMHGPYEPPQFNQEQGLMKNIGEGFRAAGMAAMPPEQLLQAQQLQAEYDKANQLAIIRENEMQRAMTAHQQQMQMEQQRIDEDKYWHDVQKAQVQGMRANITGEPVKDEYLRQAGAGKSPAQIIADPTYQSVVKAKQALDAEGKSDTAAAADAQFRDIEAKKAQNLPLTPQEVAQDKAYRIQKTLAPIAGATVRVEGMTQSRQVQVINPDTGNLEIVNMEDVNRAKAEGHPYIPAQAGMKVGQVISRLNDMKQAAKSVEQNIGVLDKAAGADMAAALADPEMTVTRFMQGQARRPMTDQQKQFVADVFSLKEQAMGVRSVMGAGQGSEDVRHAILNTLPGIASGDSKMGRIQLTNMYKLLDRIKAGVPKVSGAWGQGMETTGEQGTPSTPSTGAERKFYKGAYYEKGGDGQWHKTTAPQ